jgi:hypothetical protein
VLQQLTAHASQAIPLPLQLDQLYRFSANINADKPA